MKIAQVPGDQIPFSPKLLSSPYSIINIAYFLTEGLVKKGHDVTAFVPSDSKTSARVASRWIPSTDPRFKKYKFGSKERFELFKKYCQNLISQAEKFDIIHIHDVIGYSILRFFKKQKIQTPFVATLHAPTLSPRFKYLKDVMWVAVSQKQIKNNPNLNFIGYVHHGLPLKFYLLNEKPKNYLLWMGRITPEKGTWEAIKVAKKVKRKLLIAGDFSTIGKRAQNYTRKIKQEIRKNKKIIYLGFIKSFKQKVDILKNASALLFPIKWEEPFGLLMVEAMACGTPVIAFDRGSASEIIKNGKTGFLVKNISEMVKAVNQIFRLSRKKCRAWVEKNFTIKKMTEGYEKIYQKVIKRYKK